MHMNNQPITYSIRPYASNHNCWTSRRLTIAPRTLNKMAHNCDKTSSTHNSFYCRWKSRLCFWSHIGLPHPATSPSNQLQPILNGCNHGSDHSPNPISFSLCLIWMKSCRRGSSQITEDNADTFQRMAGAIVYGHPVQMGHQRDKHCTISQEVAAYIQN